VVKLIKEIYGEEADAAFERELKKLAGLNKPVAQAATQETAQD